MTRATFILRGRNQRELAAQFARTAPDGTTVEFKKSRRSISQNSLLWARLTDISRQVTWHGAKLTAEDWKCIATASLRKCRFVPGIDPGTVVPLGLRTSDMTKAEMAELLTMLEAFGAEHGVTFSDEQENAA